MLRASVASFAGAGANCMSAAIGAITTVGTSIASTALTAASRSANNSILTPLSPGNDSSAGRLIEGTPALVNSSNTSSASSMCATTSTTCRFAPRTRATHNARELFHARGARNQVPWFEDRGGGDE